MAEQDEAGATYAEKIAAAERRLDPRRPATELARVVRALTPHVGAYLRPPTGSASGVRRARPVEVSVRAGELKVEWGALLLGCGAEPCASRSSSRRAASRWRPTPTCAAKRPEAER